MRQYIRQSLVQIITCCLYGSKPLSEPSLAWTQDQVTISNFKNFGNKANLRDLIAATGLVILLKLDSNHRFFSPCDLEIWWSTSKNSRALVNSNRSHSPETLNSSRIWHFLSHVTLKFDRWHWKTIGHTVCAILSFVHHFVAIGEFKLELQSRNAQFGSKSAMFFSRVTLKSDGWPWKTIGHLF